MRIHLLVLAPVLLVGCAGPATVVHLSAPGGGAWTVRDAAGAPMCALPCRLELEPSESVVVARHGGGQQFVVQQQSLGAGTWNGFVRERREASEGGRAVEAFSGALMTAGGTMLASRREERVGAGVALSGVATVALLAARAWPTTRRDELWLERAATP